MRMHPNHTTLEGEVERITRCADGYGADVEVRVSAPPSADRLGDFTGARVGQTLTLFAAAPEALRCGAHYRIEASVLGGPRGEKVVLERASEMDVAVRPSPARARRRRSR